MMARRSALSVALVVLAGFCLLALGCDSSNALDSVTATTSMASVATTAPTTTAAPTTAPPATAPPTTAAPGATQSTAAVSLPNTELLMVGRWVWIGERGTYYMQFLPWPDDDRWRSEAQRLIDSGAPAPDGIVGIGHSPPRSKIGGGRLVSLLPGR